MSADDQGGAGRREIAYRLFAAEFDDSNFSYSESDEERAPNYVVTPTGARVNRLFLVGVLTEVETVSEDYLRARIVDPSGPFVVYAGQYQPEALAFLESADPPTFVAVTGKARTYQPDDSDQVYTSVRPETISEVDAATRDRWVVQTAEQTVDRVARAAEAKHSGLSGDDLRAALEAHGVEEGLAAGIPIALEHYGTTGAYLAAVRSLAIDAARVVADERDEVDPLSTLPDQGDDAPIPSLVETPIEADTAGSTEATETADDGPEPASTSADSRPGTAEASTETTGTESPGSQTPTTETDSAGESATVESAAGAAGSSESTASESTTDEPVTTGQQDRSESAQETASEHGSTASTGTSAESPDETQSVDDAVTTGDGTTGDDPTTDHDAAPTEDAAADDDNAADEEADDLGDFDPEFDLDDEEREEIESEYGTEFQSGTEVDDPGEADIETPDPDEVAPEAAPAGDSATATTPPADAETTTTETEEPTADADTAGESDDSGADAGDAEAGASDAEPADDVDLEDAVMDAMGDLDDGDGAERTAIVETVADRTGSDPGTVEDAIQDALMGGRCYEPEDGLLKPI